MSSLLPSILLSKALPATATAEPKKQLHRLALICENCDKPTDRCKKELLCGTCSGCEQSKKTCACAKCGTCKVGTSDYTCVYTTCDFGVKDCLCTDEAALSAYCVWCGQDPCYCDAEYQEYMAGKDVCIECGEHYRKCDCYEPECGNCGEHHNGKCRHEKTREDDE